MIGLRAPGAEGGVEGVVAELGPRLAARGCEVTVFCRPRYNTHGRAWRGMELVDVPTVYTKHLEAIVHTSLAMPTLLGRGFDVIHIHAIGNALLSFFPRLIRLPVVVTVHALDWRREKWGPVARGALRTGAWVAGRFPDALIAVSGETADKFEGAPMPVVRIPNGVEPCAYAPLADADVLGLKPGYILSLGRIVPEKNLETLIRAHAVAKTGRELVITGGHGHAPAYLAHLQRLADQLAPGTVRFTGSRFGTAKAALLHHAAAVAFPSHLEGLPLALLEAMATGRIVLASDIAPHRELLPDRHGVLLPVDDVSAWAKALRDVHRDGFDGLGVRAEARAREVYGWDPIADRTLGLYHEVIAKRHPGSPLVAERLRTGNDPG